VIHASRPAPAADASAVRCTQQSGACAVVGAVVGR